MKNKKTDLEKSIEYFNEGLLDKINEFPTYETNPFIPCESERMIKETVIRFEEEYQYLKRQPGFKLSLKEYALSQELNFPFWFHTLFGFTPEEEELFNNEVNKRLGHITNDDLDQGKNIRDKKFNSLSADQKNEYFEWISSFE